MDVQSVFGDVPVSTFVGEYLHRLPFALTGSAHGMCEMGGWDALGTIVSAADADVMVLREGQPYGELRPADVARARALSAQGYTIVVRHAERRHPGLAELARSFGETFGGPVDIQMLATPPGAAGFSWHYDAEDVFILQTAGEKDYGLRKNTVNPWPLEETLPADMQYERELMPLMRVSLKAGDLLYVPCGYWHKADAGNSRETAISLAVGVMSRTAMDVFDFLRRRLVDSLLWRQRLPIGGAAAASNRDELEGTYRELFARLGADIARTLNDPRLAAEYLDQATSRR
jgi:ribosomal protein L16 Arg81 hydroxylase